MINIPKESTSCTNTRILSYQIDAKISWKNNVSKETMQEEICDFDVFYTVPYKFLFAVSGAIWPQSIKFVTLFLAWLTWTRI